MKKIVSVLLCFVFAFSTLAVTASAAARDYTIESPYAQVVWEGDGAWGAYKGNLHTHSTFSDAEMDLNEMVLEHYRQGFDFLAITDHGVTGTPWNEAPAHLPLYLYQYLLGYKTTPLTDEEFAAVTSGTYPVDGQPRGKGMTCVTGGNELNALTITKCHVNGLFLPPHVGDNYLGYENDHEGAVRLADKAGGISIINHPGDWFVDRDISAVSDPKNVHYYADILLKYDSCLGMEVLNERNHATPYDRILWDNVLMECLPYGKRVIGYSNNDAHFYSHIDSSFAVFMMPENTVEQIKATVQSGALFCVTRELRGNDVIGPAESFDVRYSEVPYPSFHALCVDGHTVTVKASECTDIQWIANGKVIAHKTLEQTDADTTYVLDLDTIEGAEDFLYIRCELFGEGGCTLSQALVIDDGTAPLTYTPDTSVHAKMQTLWHKITSLRIVVLFQVIYNKLFR